ncbi:MAG TPA: undecaprenyl-diphosphate phosphatase [Vicinamibacterales bacterium]|nr:undecaprenyl-diphosphate phosphatase [Vicinamibacterales bacterium]
MPTWLQAAILGVVQGLTEFLPISSTAHLLVGERLLGFDDPNSVFTEMIQLGSILAIVWLYRGKVWEVMAGLPARPESRRFALMLIVAVLPALIAGAMASDFVESVLHKSFTTIAVAFIVGGVVMLVVERAAARPETRSIDDTSMGQALSIGLCQVLALVPGVSRSGATIVGGLLSGLDRPTAAEFSFFLAMPTLAATFGHSLLAMRHQITADRTTELVIGFVMAFIASLAVVQPFLAVVRRRGFAPFAWYRILTGIMLLIAVAGGWVR